MAAGRVSPFYLGPAGPLLGGESGHALARWFSLAALFDVGELPVE